MSRISLQRNLSAATLKKESPPPQGVVQRALESLGNFAADTAGDIAIIFGLMAMVMFILIGAAVDMGRWLNARQQTMAAIDSAVLAAGRALQTGSSIEDAKKIAEQYYKENTKTRLAVVNETITFNVPTTRDVVTSAVSVFIKTPFLGLLDLSNGHKFSTMPLLNTTGADAAKATVATNRNSDTNLEITMMLDTSGSMDEYTSSGNKKYIDMRAAAKDLVDIVVWADQTKYKSRVGIVPFSGDVRLPATIYNLASEPVTAAWPGTVGSVTTPRHKSGGSGRNAWAIDYWRASTCVAERTGNNRYTDVAPGPGNYVMPNYTDDSTCEQAKTSDEVMALTNDKTALKAKIDTLSPEGYTAGEVGTAWAWYLLSPNWASVLPAASQPASYGATKTKKIAILMTDGDYNSTHDIQGIKNGLKGSGANANGDSSPVQAKKICEAMKAAPSNVEVYTIGFQVGGNVTAIDTLSHCATDASHFYNAADGEQIKQAFRDIALKAVALYLSE